MGCKEYSLIREVQSDRWWWLSRQRVLQSLIEAFIAKPGAKLSIIGSHQAFSIESSI